MFYEGGKLINTRLGSEVDYENLKLLFKHLRYDLVKTQEELSDLTAEVGNFNLLGAIITVHGGKLLFIRC